MATSYVKGAVFVGPKTSTGAKVTHEKLGFGTVVGVYSESVTVTHDHAGLHLEYAAVFAQQKAKLIPTGSDKGKTCLANVTVTKLGWVENRDDGKVIGNVYKSSQGDWAYVPNAGMPGESGFSSKHMAVKALVKRYNWQADNPGMVYPPISEAHVVKPLLDKTTSLKQVGAAAFNAMPPLKTTIDIEPAISVVVVPSELAAVKNLGDVNHLQFSAANVKTGASGAITGSDMVTEGVKIGFTVSNGDGTMQVFHVDGHLVAEKIVPGTGGATQMLSEYHNKTHGTWAAATEKVAALLASVVIIHDKFQPTTISTSVAGLHNDPSLAYVEGAYESRSQSYKDAACVAVSKKVYQAVPGSHFLNLSTVQKSAVKKYTHHSFEEINSELRSGVLSSTIQTLIKHIDAAFMKTPELDQSIVVYRGINYAGAMDLFGKLGSRVGQVVLDPAYASTSAFASSSFSSQGVMVRITIPAGTHVLKPSMVGYYGDGEREIMLPRDTEYKVMWDGDVHGVGRVVELVVVGTAHSA